MMIYLVFANLTMINCMLNWINFTHAIYEIIQNIWLNTLKTKVVLWFLTKFSLTITVCFTRNCYKFLIKSYSQKWMFCSHKVYLKSLMFFSNVSSRI